MNTSPDSHSGPATTETMLLAPIAAAHMRYGVGHGDSVLLQGPSTTLAWLAFGGPLTAIPLLLFAAYR